LKGLFAWLATLASEHAELMIYKEPLGILMYGDVSNLAVTHRLILLKALERLSQQDPWFNKDDTGHELLGALSSAALAPEFVRLLNEGNRNFHLRMLILNAIGYGPQIPQLERCLFDVLSDQKAAYIERTAAFVAIRNVIPQGDQKVFRIYSEHLSEDASAIIVRAHILEEAYEIGFTPADVTCFFRDYLNYKGIGATGELYWFADNFPLNDLPAILDGLSGLAPADDYDGECDGGREVDRSFASMLTRYLSLEMPSITTLHRWLKAFSLFKKHHYGYDKNVNRLLREWLLDSPAIIYELFDVELSWFTEGTCCSLLWDFERLILETLDRKQFLEHVQKRCIKGGYSKNVESIVFELCLMFAIQFELDFINEFGELLEYAEGKAELLALVKVWDHSKVDDWRGQDARRLRDK
jgi:hypothetical protein